MDSSERTGTVTAAARLPFSLKAYNPGATADAAQTRHFEEEMWHPARNRALCAIEHASRR
ncbi:MAG: hypothetical protein V7788_03130 [Alphaproteobacteria bacterium]